METQQIIKRFTQAFKELACSERAKQEKRYLKSPFNFYGLTSSQLDFISRQFKKDHPNISFNELWSLCFDLWNSNWHENRKMATNLLREYSDYLDYKIIPKIEKMLYQSTNWDQVDEISAHLMGEIILKDFSRVKKYLIKWSDNKNFWLRRASLLSPLYLYRKKYCHLPQCIESKKLFFELAEKMLDESKFREEEFETQYMPEKMGKFFIRKVIGWVLREMSETDPGAVIKFVNKNKKMMSGLTYREATRRLPENYRKKLKV